MASAQLVQSLWPSPTWTQQQRKPPPPLSLSLVSGQWSCLFFKTPHYSLTPWPLRVGFLYAKNSVLYIFSSFPISKVHKALTFLLRQPRLTSSYRQNWYYIHIYIIYFLDGCFFGWLHPYDSMVGRQVVLKGNLSCRFALLHLYLHSYLYPSFDLIAAWLSIRIIQLRCWVFVPDLIRAQSFLGIPDFAALLFFFSS